MAKIVTGKVRATLSAAFSEAKDVGTVQSTPALSVNDVFTNGSGANKIEAVVYDTDSIAASGSADIDLAGALKDPAGDLVTLTKVKGFIVKNTSTVGDGITVGGTFATWLAAAGDAVKVMPGGSLVISNPTAAGYAVTAGSADLLTLTNLDAVNAQTYEVEVLGEVS